MKFFKDFKLPKLSLLPSIFSKVPHSINLLSLFPPSIKTNHSSLPKENCGNKFSQDSSRKLCLEKKDSQMIWIFPLKKMKRKEVKEDPNSVG